MPRSHHHEHLRNRNAFTDGFASITSGDRATRLRYQSELRVKERVCPDCNTIRVEAEFGVFENCNVCRGRGKKPRRKS